jgi:lysophospholipase L1-like esterase
MIAGLTRRWHRRTRRWIKAVALTAALLLAAAAAGECELRGASALSLRWQARRGAAAKLLCLGDSFTAGAGVAAGRSYPHQLQGLLDQRYGAGRVQAIDGGQATANSSETLSLLDRTLRCGLRPDFVLVTAGADNLWNWRLATPMFRGADSLERLRRATRGVRLLRFLDAARENGVLAAKKLYFPNDANVNPLVAKLALTNADWLKAWLIDDVQAMARLCEAVHARLVLVGYPYPSPAVQGAQDILRGERGVLFVNAGNFGLPLDNDVRSLLQADGVRPNAAGFATVARLVADALAPALDEKLNARRP